MGGLKVATVEHACPRRNYRTHGAADRDWESGAAPGSLGWWRRAHPRQQLATRPTALRRGRAAWPARRMLAFSSGFATIVWPLGGARRVLVSVVARAARHVLCTLEKAKRKAKAGRRPARRPRALASSGAAAPRAATTSRTAAPPPPRVSGRPRRCCSSPRRAAPAGARPRMPRPRGMTTAPQTGGRSACRGRRPPP